MKPYIIITAMLATATASPAFAQSEADRPSTTALDAKLAQADALYREANKLVGEGKLPLAIEKYRAALALKPTYDIAGNLGLTEMAEGHYADAAEHFALSLRGYPVNAEAAAREGTVKKLTEARAKIGTLRIAAPAGAAIVLDGRVLGQAPLGYDAYCDPGKHVLEARLKGHATTSKTINPKAGEEVAVTLPKGVAIKSDPAADGRSYLPEIVLGAVGVVFLATGAVLYGVAAGVDNSAAEKLAALPSGGANSPCDLQSNAALCAPIVEDADNAYALSGAGIGMMAAGGAALAAGVVHFAIVGTGEGEASTEAVSAFRITPMFGGVNGLQLSGSF